MQFESAEEQEAFLSKADHLHKWSGECQYENLLLDVLQNGVPSNDRTGVGTISLFGTRMEFDLSKAFPLITSKKVFLKGVIVFGLRRPRPLGWGGSKPSSFHRLL
ncbi:thymidylate synthase [Bifidobacterium pseudocatenulatum]|uniref:Thymidylate synthase n=1 Tax=Bifidobacterium pseudocatenulatum TaxID=28026 RepID=A0ABD4W6V0_BIFPS|nr:thymidylate synthase [Bifidobacterium pseudocatenulatum]MDB6490687.1 thymidylate synthase [Bifidobacterium pseudocatenulatum]MDB6494488.1 thymidylate synthase [Bifidobacterium pseudocatenulatum]MDB6503368.1 thymidylate synthase [Bifidobacterium pseudocatenulatum]